MDTHGRRAKPICKCHNVRFSSNLYMVHDATSYMVAFLAFCNNSSSLRIFSTLAASRFRSISAFPLSSSKSFSSCFSISVASTCVGFVRAKNCSKIACDLTSFISITSTLSKDDGLEVVDSEVVDEIGEDGVGGTLGWAEDVGGA